MGKFDELRDSPTWDGKTSKVVNSAPNRVDVTLTNDAARMLALALARLKQTTISLTPEVEELLTALNYVLVGDPASRAAHARMEAGKGMTPDGGHRAPNHTFWPSEHSSWDGFRCGWKLPDGSLCSKSKEEH